MHHPEDPADDENWLGGFYELAINLGPRVDGRLGKALFAVWRAAGVDCCLARDHHGRHRDAVLSVESIARYGHLVGVTRLPDHGHIVCGAAAIREEQGNDWLDFYLPLGALGRHNPRAGAFPFGDDGGAVSRSWREPLHQWLSQIGEQTFNAAPFLYAGIGFEASGLSLDKLMGSNGRHFHVLAVRDSELEILPVTRWDFGMPGWPVAMVKVWRDVAILVALPPLTARQHSVPDSLHRSLVNGRVRQPQPAVPVADLGQSTAALPKLIGADRNSAQADRSR